VPESDHLIHLPPRLVQPAALRFRLLAADDGDGEANAHPDTNPICGWLLPNDLDNSLAIYNSGGLALGAVTAKPRHPWQPAPGSAAAVDSPSAITDPHLRKVVDYLLGHGAAFVDQFISMIGNALARIEPESAAQHPELALLVGRPLALVRAQISLALQGLPAIHQSWQALRQDLPQDLHRTSRDSDNFPNVRFPVHLGAYQRWNDGLVGFWREDTNGQWGETFYAPQSAPSADGADDSSWNPVTSPLIRLGDAPDFHLQLALTTPPQTVVLLWDPRAPIHLLSGFLPVKSITLPPDHYVAALQAIEVTFFTAPLLTETNKVRLPLPSEPGYRWSWLQNTAGRWAEVGTVGIVTRGDFGQAFGDAGDALWTELIALGWLTDVDADRAAVAAQDQRSATPLSPFAEPYRAALEDLLERSHIGPPQAEATFAGPQGLRDGWLTLRVVPITDAEPLTLTRMRKRSI
ncbi:MAG: hypothetical protein KDE53_24185, partial [Caldilineaceae bacterium]|nr:hypothetical protein [Caldilineaceae bacterium]